MLKLCNTKVKEIVDGDSLARLKKQIAILLERCLSLDSGDELLVIYDEEFCSYLSVLVEACRDRGILPSFLFVPVSLQDDLAATTQPDHQVIRMPSAFVAAVSDSLAVLNVLNGSSRTSIVRGAILDLSRPENCKFGHIPGFSTDVLAVLEKSPMDEILRLCDLTAWALGEASALDLITTDLDGRQHVLRLELQSWDNDPLMSPGIIPAGSWGNIPPGESFICPTADAANGSVCINGSIPNYVFPEGEEVILHFDNGALSRWEAKDSVAANTFFSDHAERAANRNDRHWNRFAELGIGLNRSIVALTGNSLFDEKAYRTIHIAIGDNECFGHSIKSDIHEDLVCTKPTLKTPKFDIIIDGELNLEGILAARRARQSGRPDLRAHAFVRLIRERAAIRDGVLYRRLHSAGRVGYVSIADDELSKTLAIFWDTALNQGDLSVESLTHRVADRVSYSPRKMLQMLMHYRMVILE